MKERKLNFRIHDPNPAELSADTILKMMIEVNTVKVEKALRQQLDRLPAQNTFAAVNPR